PPRDAFAAGVGATGPAQAPIGQAHTDDALQAARHVDLADVMAALLQSVDHGGADAALLDLGRTILRVEVRQCDRLLDVEVPVEYPDQGFCDVPEYLRYARRADRADGGPAPAVADH